MMRKIKNNNKKEKLTSMAPVHLKSVLILILLISLTLVSINLISAEGEGCCFNAEDGFCTANADAGTCAELGGEFYDSESCSISQCDKGCCE